MLDTKNLETVHLIKYAFILYFFKKRINNYLPLIDLLLNDLIILFNDFNKLHFNNKKMIDATN